MSRAYRRRRATAVNVDAAAAAVTTALETAFAFRSFYVCVGSWSRGTGGIVVVTTQHNIHVHIRAN